MFRNFPILKWRKTIRHELSHEISEYSNEEICILDKYTLYRGIFKNKYDFVVVYILASVGLGNVRSFPMLVYLHGGAAFIVLYIFLSIILGVPLFIIESGLSQFYSMGESRLFRIVPYFMGLGWTIHVLNLILIIPYSIEIQWHLNYLIEIFFVSKPQWSKCSSIKNIICVATENMLNETSNDLNRTPASIFFEFNVQGARNPDDGTVYTFSNSLKGYRHLQLILIFSVWSVIVIFTLIFSKMYMKFWYFLIIFCSLTLTVLTCKSLVLKGAFKGISHFLSPDLAKLFTGESLKSAVKQVIFSLCIAKSCSSFASLSDFKFNFFRSSFIIVFGDFSFSFLSGIMIFSVLGFMSTKLDIPIESLIKRDNTFVNLVDASIMQDERQIWIFLFMLMAALLGISTISVICTAFTISFIDFYPNFMNRSELKKCLVCTILCVFLSFVSLFFCLNGSVIYLHLFTHHIEDISQPLVILSEIVLVQFVYGAKRLRLEIKMMIGYTYNIIYVFFSITIVPILIIFNLIYSVSAELRDTIPIWAIILTYFVSLVPLLPFIISFIIQFINNYRSQIGIDILKVGLKTSKIYGPYYKRNWLLSKYYQRKLVLVRKDPEFLKTIRETENLEDILISLRRMYIQEDEEPVVQSNLD